MSPKEKREVSPAKYAKLCGTSRQAIVQRIESGVIKSRVEFKQKREYHFIDIDKYPPVKLKRGRKNALLVAACEEMALTLKACKKELWYNGVTEESVKLVGRINEVLSRLKDKEAK